MKKKRKSIGKLLNSGEEFLSIYHKKGRKNKKLLTFKSTSAMFNSNDNDCTNDFTK